MSKVHKKKLEGASTGQIWNNLTTKMIMNINELLTIKKQKFMSPQQYR